MDDSFKEFGGIWQRRRTSGLVWKIFAGIILLFLTVSVWGMFLLTAPSDFPIDTPVEITSGMTGSEAIAMLAHEGLVRSETMFYLVTALYFDLSSVQAGVYSFSTPHNTFALARAITHESSSRQQATITFPEGITARTMADIAANRLHEFDSDMFLEIATPHEGFLFPDTYTVPINYHATELVTLLQSTYEKRIESLRPRIAEHTLSERDIIILASILEREAKDEESMRMVSGILQNRLATGMRLQADATVGYVLEKPLAELVPADLEIESPYNTYYATGLPPTAIGNPGLRAIEAVLNPAETDHLFYITDGDGQFHYATTLVQHNENIDTYLR